MQTVQRHVWLGRALGAIALLVLLHTPGWAQYQTAGFIQPRKKGFAWYGVTYQRTNGLYLLGYDRVAIPTLQHYRVVREFTYGLTDRLTLVVGLMPHERSSLNRQVGATSGEELFAGDVNAGFSDQELGLRYRIGVAGASVWSVYLELGIPTGEASQANGLLTGDGEWDQTLGLQFFHHAPASALSFGAEAGYQHRTRGFADQIRFQAFARYQVAPLWRAKLRLVGTQSVYNTDYYRPDGSLIGGDRGIGANAVSDYSLEPTLHWQLLPKWGIGGELGASYVVVGENIPTGWTYRGALTWDTGRRPKKTRS